ncbi:MAG: cupredoxin domain-containing protein [Sporichthyaceae bacterium]
MRQFVARRPRLDRVALSAAVAGCTGLALLLPTSADASDSAPRLTHNVAIADFRFVPGNLGIDVGDSVRWVNTDAHEHNVRYVRGPARFGMTGKHTLDRGEKYKHTFNRRGIYLYECTIHGERGEIRVGPKQTTAAPDGPGYDTGPLEPYTPRRLPPTAPPPRPDLPR